MILSLTWGWHKVPVSVPTCCKLKLLLAKNGEAKYRTAAVGYFILVNCIMQTSLPSPHTGPVFLLFTLRGLFLLKDVEQ